jgi:hypothetical protein
MAGFQAIVAEDREMARSAARAQNSPFVYAFSIARSGP